LSPISNICDEIYLKIINTDLIKTKIIIVTHSFGSFYAFYLAEKYYTIFNKLFLIEPTIKTANYKNYLKNCNSTIQQHKYNNFDALPTGLNIKCSVIIWIIININTDSLDDSFKCELEYMYKLTNKNIKSKMITHINKSHMLHYDIPDVIKNAICEIISLK
jgi:hypothetical protein